MVGRPKARSDRDMHSVGPISEPTPEYPEAKLIELAKSDPSAFARLYRDHYPGVVGYLFRRTGDRHTAEDLAADTFLSAMKAIPRYRVTGVPIRMWFLRIATNAANRWARQRRRLKLERIAPSPTAPNSQDRHAALEEAQRALLTLPPNQQAVLSLHYLESLTLDEVAAVLGWNLGTVKSRLARGRAAMKAELERRSSDHG